MLDYKNDFFEAINENWIREQELDDSQTHIDSFTSVRDDIDSYIYRESKKWLGSKNFENHYLHDFITFYRQALDFDKRESLGATPLLPILNKYRSINSFEDYLSQLSKLEILGLPNLVPFQVLPDLVESRKNMVWAGAPGLTFPDSSFYDFHSEQEENLLDIWYASQRDLLTEIGLSVNEADDILRKVIELDRKLLEFLSPRDENEDYKVYNFLEFQKVVPNLPLETFFKNLTGIVPEKIIVTEEIFWNKFAPVLYSNEMWDLIKAKLIYGVVQMYSHCLTNRINELSSKFRNFILGIESNIDKEKEAYELTRFALGTDLSYWYSNQIILDSDKAAIEILVEEIVNFYRSQIEISDNLPLDLRQIILKKLDNLVVQIGGPTSQSIIEKKLFDEENLVESVNKVLASSAKHRWDKLVRLNERDEWEVDSFVVDAYYDSQNNKIVLPAGILQKPFYSNEYSTVKNLSRIGFLIAHEISHVFDMEGIMFDEYGNKISSLSEESNEYFQSMINKVFLKYEERVIEGYNINSWQTISENIADIAGFSCIEKIIVSKFPERLAEFYKEFTSLWRIKQRPEYLEMIILTDSHLPNKLRVNSLLSNSRHFIELYNISEIDEMFLDSKEQLLIW